MKVIQFTLIIIGTIIAIICALFGYFAGRIEFIAFSILLFVLLETLKPRTE